MISIVVVSHSRAVAAAALELAEQMVEPAHRPVVVIAAGLDEHTLGTDAMSIAQALEQAACDDGTLVLLDLGSALLSTEMALEFVDADVAERVRISPAPLVEGLLAALVTASTGATLERTDAEARASLRAKQEHLDGPPAEGLPLPAQAPTGVGDPDDRTDPTLLPEPLVGRWTIRNEHGLHARPAAALSEAMAEYDAEVLVRNASAGGDPVTASSISSVATLGLACGDELEATFSGPQAEAAKARLDELVGHDFGDPQHEPYATEPAPTPTASTAPVVLDLAVDTSGYLPGDQQVEAERLAQARERVAAAISSIPTDPGYDKVLQATLQLVRDRVLVRSANRAMADGASAVWATKTSTRDLVDRFQTMPNAYLALRAQDVRSIGRMLLAALVDAPLLPPIPAGTLLVDELDAVTAARIDPQRNPLVLVRAAGDDAHGPMIARARGIEVRTGIADADALTGPAS